MLSNYEVHATIPAKNLERARKFYEETLGMKPHQESPAGIIYKAKDSFFLLYETQLAGTAKNTAASFVVDNVEKVVKELKDKGIKFEKFDMPGVEWNGDIAVLGDMKGAWFKDPEDNILAISDMKP